MSFCTLLLGFCYTKENRNIINYILFFYLKQLFTFNLICFRRQPIYPLHYKNIPVGATTEEVEYIRRNMAYSNPEEVVKPMEHNEDITENMEIQIIQRIQVIV